MFNMGFGQAHGQGMSQMGMTHSEVEMTQQGMDAGMGMMNCMMGEMTNMMGGSNTMMGGMMGMMGCMMNEMMAHIDPQAVARFNALDSDHSGTITVDEIQKAYSEFSFSAHSAQLLLSVITDKSVIDTETFPVFDQYIMSFHKMFKYNAIDRNTLVPIQLSRAISMLKLTVKQPTIDALIKKYDTDNNGVEFGEFMSICAYLLMVEKVFAKYDPKNTGVLTLDKTGLQNLALWFM
ncbi:Programmed_cell death protein-like protein [Hexamita inflata]|uniref:Programmed cell death protein-like protein n=2 Tax=Hexamita inflata TaxID=28002 RepID=A0AA86UKF2_9EUKA|nr:Programmed cell death protein-like protein [Hexamita inflata]